MSSVRWGDYDGPLISTQRDCFPAYKTAPRPQIVKKNANETSEPFCTAPMAESFSTPPKNSLSVDLRKEYSQVGRASLVLRRARKANQMRPDQVTLGNGTACFFGTTEAQSASASIRKKSGSDQPALRSSFQPPSNPVTHQRPMYGTASFEHVEGNRMPRLSHDAKVKAELKRSPPPSIF